MRQDNCSHIEVMNISCNHFRLYPERNIYHRRTKHILSYMCKLYKASNVFLYIIGDDIIIYKKSCRLYQFALEFYHAYQKLLNEKKVLVFDCQNQDDSFQNKPLFKPFKSFYAIPLFNRNSLVGYIGIKNPHRKQEQVVADNYLEPLAQLYENNFQLNNAHGRAQFTFEKKLKLVWFDEGFKHIYHVLFHNIANYFQEMFAYYDKFHKSTFINRYFIPNYGVKYLYLSIIANHDSSLFDVYVLDITPIKDKLTFSFEYQFMPLDESNCITNIKLDHNYQITSATDTFYQKLRFSEKDFNVQFNHYFFGAVCENESINIKEQLNVAISKQTLFFYDVKLIDRLHNPVDALLLVNPLISNETTITVIFPSSIEEEEIHKYNLIPGCIGKFLIGKRVQLLYANDKFFNFFGYNYEKCNNYCFPPVYYEDVKFVHAQIERMRLKVPVNFDVRVKKGNGNLCWVRIEGNCVDIQNDYPVYLLLFVDISQQRSLEFDLKSKQEKLAMVSNDENYNLFEYDIINDIYTGKTYYNYQSNYIGKNVTINNYLENIQKTRTHFEYYHRWHDFLLGINNEPFDFCISDEDSTQEKWLRVSGTAIFDGKKPVKVIGKFTDYTQKKVKEQQFIEKSKYDCVSDLYNKEHGEYLVRQRLETSSNESYLLVIDLDNFKAINHHFGYMFGNVIINDFGSLLMNQTTNEEIVYRLGSDEFVIFLGHKELSYVTNLCNRINSAIKTIYLGETSEVTLSCTIGITHLNNKYELEEVTNKGLKAISKKKNTGINTFYYIDELDMDFTNFDINKFEEEHFNLQSEENIVLFALDILEKSLNVYAAINILLSRIGKQFNLASICIIDVNYEELKSNVRHWWIKDNYMLSFPQELHLNKEVLDSIINEYSYNEMFEITPKMHEEFFKIHNITYTPNQKIVFSCANYEMNKFAGAIFFEPLMDNTTLSNSHKYILYELSKIIFMHTQKIRIDNLNKEQTFILSKVSHDIRTPLNSIILMTKMAMNYSHNNTNFSNYLSRVDTSAKYLLSLVNNILDFSQIESGKMKLCLEKADLNKMIDNIYSLLRIQADQKKIKFEIIRQFTHQFVQTDLMRLNQVLINLVGNAIKFTPDGGMVMVTIKETFVDDNFVTMKFLIKDNGVGISKENLSRIFLPFEQGSPETNKNYGGTGLGLTISYNLVKLMGGLLQVESEVGKGSKFFFSLPFIKVNEIETSKELLNLDYTKFHNKHILLVEDNDLNAEITKTILDNMGFIVVVASNGTMAIEKYKDANPHYYQAILMDIRMPDMDGFKATKIIRELGKADSSTIPIIAMTANTFDEDANKAIQFGMNHYLTKPVDLVNLYRVLNKYV